MDNEKIHAIQATHIKYVVYNINNVFIAKYRLNVNVISQNKR